jgi:hypothetical protein
MTDVARHRHSVARLSAARLASLFRLKPEATRHYGTVRVASAFRRKFDLYRPGPRTLLVE